MPVTGVGVMSVGVGVYLSSWVYCYSSALRVKLSYTHICVKTALFGSTDFMSFQRTGCIPGLHLCRLGHFGVSVLGLRTIKLFSGDCLVVLTAVALYLSFFVLSYIIISNYSSLL